MMRKRLGLLIVAWIVGAAHVVSGAPDEASVQAEMASRLTEMARNTLRAKQVTDPVWQSAVALLRGAVRLDPQTARYHRLLLEAQLRLGRTDEAIETARGLLKLEPANQSAQLELIDLFLSRMQTVDARMDYLRDLLGKPSIPSEVRSRLASRLAALLQERSQPDAARDMLSQSLRLDGLNPDALAMRYQMVRGHGALERVSVILDLLLSNPARPALMAELAGELANVGLVQPALDWYGQSLALSGRMGVAVSHSTAMGYASELVLADQLSSATTVIGHMLEADPTDPDAWMLRLVVERMEKNIQYAQSAEKAEAALLGRLDEIGKLIGKQTGTTLPSDNVASDAKAVGAGASGELVAAYQSALTDLAWFELYFNEKPEVARKYIQAIQAVSSPDSVTVARLEGWAYLLEGKRAEARTKLSAVRDRDPLAALGLLRAGEEGAANKERDASVGRKLLNDNPSTLVGAILYGALRDQGAKLVTTTQADAIQERLGAFPMDWLQILDRPEAFYAIRAEPVRVAHEYGEPLLARITLVNLGKYPLTIGDEGIIHPDLWIDANLRGMVERQLPGVAYDRLTKVLVLPPGQQIGQLVRIDQGALSGLLASNPGMTIQVYATVLTNPVSGQNGVVSGAGGYQVRFSRLFERTGTPLNSQESKDKVIAQATEGPAAARLRGMQLVAAYVQLFEQQTDERLKPIVDDLRAGLKRSAEEGGPWVQAWGRYLNAVISQPEESARLVQQMGANVHWGEQLLGLVAARGLPTEAQKQFDKVMVDLAQDEVVKAYAEASLALASMPTTRPASGPATAPAQTPGR